MPFTPDALFRHRPGLDNSTGGVTVIRIVLADDHWLVRSSTRQMLEQYEDLQVVGEAADGDEAVDLIQRLQPDVAVLDLRMPRRNAILVTQHLQEVAPATRCLVLSAYADEEWIQAAQAAGATSYVLKTARARELADAVRRAGAAANGAATVLAAPADAISDFRVYR